MIVVPRAFSTSQVPDLLQEKQKWILGHLDKINQCQQSANGREIKPGDTIRYLGRAIKVLTEEASGRARHVRLEENTLVFSLPRTDGDLGAALERWYRSETLRLLKEKTANWAHRMNVRPGRLTVRGQKSRWASCSSRDSLSFNWKLLMAPEPVIDYVVIHELAHLKQMDHSKRFWRLVLEYCPDGERHRKWLRAHGDWLAKSPSPV